MDTTAGRARTALSPPQTFALAFGILYLAVGILGFAVTGLDGFFASSFGEKLIVFPLNPAHNVVHLLIGAAWLGSFRKHAAARTANLAIGAAYLLVFLLGLVGALKWLAIPAGFDADQILHVLTGAVAMYFGTAGAGALRGITA
jgi:F0F1-type ATP synthase membrane subunit a